MRDDRNRQRGTLDEFDRLPEDQLDGSIGVLLRTFTETTYPTAAASVFACHPVSLNVGDQEGDGPALIEDTDTTIYAVNLGDQIPVAGSYVIGFGVGGRTSFLYNG